MAINDKPKWGKTKEGFVIAIKVIPRSHKNEVVGWENDELKIRIRAVPDKGRANEELIEFLAEYLKIAKSNLVITSGQTSRHKRVLATGFDPNKLS
jgi:hypothetical protein